MNALTLEQRRQCVAARTIIKRINRLLAGEQRRLMTFMLTRESAYQVLRRYGQACPATHPLLLNLVDHNGVDLNGVAYEDVLDG